MLALACSMAAQANLSKPYSKWIEEDAAYIITPEERAEFAKLTKDTDRDRFIEQFWLRRDPTPGTPENEFKEEHYRRIGYSNEHFSDRRQGWKTDRGRVYIVEGPPDEIIQVPFKLDGGPQHRTQDWRYLSGKKFRFVDECDCGEYRMEQSRPKSLFEHDCRR